MEFEGKVLEILPPVSGQSARGTWERQTVVFEQANKQFGKEVAVTFMNKGQDVSGLRVGESYIVSFDIESRNYQGRWYTDVVGRKIEPKEAAQVAQAQYSEPLPTATPTPAPMAAPMATPMPTEEPAMPAQSAAVVDDLPF